MIERIIDVSARHRVLVLLLTVVLALFAVRAMHEVPLDAIPDLSDTKVIVLSKWDRSPHIIEDQVTYPIVSALLGSPKVKAIRGDYGKPDPLPVEMLRQLAQSAFLGGAAQPPMPQRGESEVAENAGPASASASPPTADSSPHTDEDPAVRLQPDDAARSDGDRPDAVDHARRER